MDVSMLRFAPRFLAYGEMMMVCFFVLELIGINK